MERAVAMTTQPNPEVVEVEGKVEIRYELGRVAECGGGGWAGNEMAALSGHDVWKVLRETKH